MTRNGIPVIPQNSHIALAHHRDSRERFLRRPYNYDDPPAAGQTSDTGLIFVTYQRDIDTQFLPVQRRLAEFDALNQWTTAIGSAVFVVLPGVTTPDGYLGQRLLEGASQPEQVELVAVHSRACDTCQRGQAVPVARRPTATDFGLRGCEGAAVEQLHAPALERFGSSQTHCMRAVTAFMDPLRSWLRIITAPPVSNASSAPGKRSASWVTTVRAWSSVK